MMTMSSGGPGPVRRAIDGVGRRASALWPLGRRGRHGRLRREIHGRRGPARNGRLACAAGIVLGSVLVPAAAHPPAGIGIDDRGDVICIEAETFRIVVFDRAATAGPEGAGGPAGSAGPRELAGGIQGAIRLPHQIVRGRGGGLYTVDSERGLVHRVDGSATRPLAEDEAVRTGGIGRAGDPFAVAEDGTVYWVDGTAGRESRLVRQAPGGEVELVAGGAMGHADGQGAAARFGDLHGSVFVWGPDGSLYLTDDGRYVRRVDADGTVTTIAGGPERAGRDGPGPDARFQRIYGLTIADDGTIYCVDVWERAVRRIDRDGTVHTVGGRDADGRPRLELIDPTGIAIDARGDLWVLEQSPAPGDPVRLTRLRADGTIVERRVWRPRPAEADIRAMEERDARASSPAVVEPGG